MFVREGIPEFMRDKVVPAADVQVQGVVIGVMRRY